MSGTGAPRPEVSVLVVAYRSADLLPSALASAAEAAGSLSTELVVVDNASPDGGTAEAVRASGRAVRLVELARNVGFARAVDVGAAVATGELVCLLNPDARPAPGAVAELVAAARRRPGHLLYSGRVLTPDGEVDPGCCAALPSLREYLCFASGLSTAFPGTALDPRSLGGWRREDERVVPAVSGAFVLFDRQVFLAAGGFDPAYFMYSEDTDLSARAHRLGRPPLLVPTATAVHLNGASSSPAAKAEMVLRGKCTYLRRNWTPWRAGLAVGLLDAGVSLRAAGSALTGRGMHWREVRRSRRRWRPGWPEPAPGQQAADLAAARVRSCTPAAPAPARP